MNVKDALQGSALPSADAEVLLAHLLGKDRAWIFAHRDEELSAAQWTLFMEYVERRRRHEPVAYIVGQQEFYGRAFTVDRRVLIPRPSTEGVIRRTLQFLADGKDAIDEVDEKIVVTSHALDRRTGTAVHIVEIGTGSGCIAITLALERPDLKIIATDISPDALDVARSNAERHRVTNRVTLLQGDGLEPIKDLAEPFLLVSNPPYIPSGNDLMADVKDYEPHVALYGGSAGTGIISKLVQEAKTHPYCTAFIIECEKGQL